MNMPKRRWVGVGGLVAAGGLALVCAAGGARAGAEEGGAAAGPADLVGAWQFVEDRTPPENKRDPRERPPLGTRFTVALEGETVVVQQTRRGVAHVMRVPLGGKEEAQKEGDTTRTYSGRFEEGRFVISARVDAPGQGKRDISVSQYTLTLLPEGLLVRMRLLEPLQIDRTALFKRTADVPPAKPVPGDLKALEWLVGRFVDAEGKAQAEEHWGPLGGGAMLGTARTVSDGKMVAFEYLRIVERAGSLVYVAQPGGGPATEFVLTEISPTRALFENPQHDYPKRIVYERIAAQAGGQDGLRTEISDVGGARAHASTYTRVP